jgi:hypothetical protein
VPVRTAAADAESCACAEAVIAVKKRGNKEEVLV